MEQQSPKLLTEREAAERLSVSVQTLRRWRGPLATGPAVTRLGRAVRYHPDEIRAFVQRCTETQPGEVR